MKIDSNATGFLHMISGRDSVVYYSNLDLESLGTHYVIWRNRKSIKELAINDNNIPKNKRKKKLEKINFFKEAVLENKHTDTTLFGMRPNPKLSIVIGDGVHRAIGIYKAYLQDNSLKMRVNLRLLLCEGDYISSIPDYALSIKEPG